MQMVTVLLQAFGKVGEFQKLPINISDHCWKFETPPGTTARRNCHLRNVPEDPSSFAVAGLLLDLLGVPGAQQRLPEHPLHRAQCPTVSIWLLGVNVRG